MIHELPKLNYGFSDLEPDIDSKTMEIHYGKHHQVYVNKLNDALKDYPDLQLLKIEELLSDLKKVHSKIRTAVENNGGGHYNHSLFWQTITKDAVKEPSGALLRSIENKFGSFSKFKEKFSKEATELFGSGWVWLVLDINKNQSEIIESNLKIVSTSGHDSPISKGQKALMVLDVWEHAYYLKYQNRRAEYIANWWNVVNWKEIEKKYNEAIGA